MKLSLSAFVVCFILPVLVKGQLQKGKFYSLSQITVNNLQLHCFILYMKAMVNIKLSVSIHKNNFWNIFKY